MCNVRDRVIDHSYAIKPSYGYVQCLNYSPAYSLCVATSEATILVLDADVRELCYVLDTKLQNNACLELSNGSYPVALRLAFSQFGDLVAGSYTDGYIRVWQHRRDLTLQHLCRLSVLKHCRICDVTRLPVPKKIHMYLLQIPDSFIPKKKSEDGFLSEESKSPR